MDFSKQELVENPDRSELPEDHSIPSSWEIAALGNVVQIIRGARSLRPQRERSKGVPLPACELRVFRTRLNWDDLILTFRKTEKPLRVDQWDYRSIDDLIISMALEAMSWSGNSRATLTVSLKERHSADSLRRSDRSDSDPKFLLWALRSPEMQAAFRSQGNPSQTTNIANISLGGICGLSDWNCPPLFLSPRSEQHRIVAKVDELMGLCDRLEAVQRERRGVRVRLNRASLERLTSASGAGARQRGSELSAAWQRVCDHFEVLYDTPETLPDFRQTILQLAVQGKLVPQNPNDEPAESQLSRIIEHKARLVADGLMKVEKPLTEIDETEKSTRTPPGWCWARLGNVAERINDGNYGESYPKKDEFVSSGIPFHIRVHIILTAPSRLPAT
ncbi:MAG: hypothetical protein R3C19_00380 [Planctomycetaceae bacterium]